MVATEPQAPNDKRAAVYIPFRTFMTAVDALKQGIPPKLDPSVWPSFSGTVQRHVLSAFKFLGLLRADGTPEPALTSLVEASDDDRRVAVHTLIQAAYPDVIVVARASGSTNNLETAMRGYGVQGGTLDKAIKFYLDAAKYADVPTSPLWKFTWKRSRGGNTDAAKAKSGVKAKKEKEAPQVIPSDQFRRAVKLKSGPTVTIVVSDNPLLLSKTDRDWVFGMIDTMEDYGQVSEG